MLRGLTSHGVLHQHNSDQRTAVQKCKLHIHGILYFVSTNPTTGDGPSRRAFLADQTSVAQQSRQRSHLNRPGANSSTLSASTNGNVAPASTFNDAIFHLELACGWFQSQCYKAGTTKEVDCITLITRSLKSLDPRNISCAKSIIRVITQSFGSQLAYLILRTNLQI